MSSAPATRVWTRWLLRALVGVVAVLLLLLLACVLIISLVNWNHVRPVVNRQVSAMLGRDFAIRGDLRIGWQFDASQQSGWRSYIPEALIRAGDVHVRNPDWSRAGTDMASARQVTVALNPLALLGRRVLISDLQMEAPTLALERSADGRKSWRFEQHNGPSAWRVEIARMAFKQGQLRYIDGVIALDLQAQVASIADAGAAINPNFGLQFTLGGTYRNSPIRGEGKAGGVLLLSRDHSVFPVQASAQLGSNKLAIEGNLTDPLTLAGMDVQLTLGGASMADLYGLTGVLLPATPAYLTRGRLIGTRGTQAWNWRYENFTGSVGQSDLAGTLDYLQQTPQQALARPLLRGAITSQQLRLADLGASIGADSNASKKARGKAEVQPDNKALPVEQFNPAKWGALDADVSFKGKKLIRSAKVPLQDVVADIHMKNKVLTLTPLNFGMAGGNVTSNLSLDGRSNAIQAQAKVAARGIQVRQLFPTLQSMQASFGEVNGDAALTGHGNSVAAMLASADGELGAVVSQGSISKFMLEAAGLNVANAIVAKLFGDKQVHMNCMISDFKVTNGRADVRRFILDTDDALVNISGDIDIASEQLNLDIRPASKGVRIISLRTPLYAKGTFSDPDVGPYKGPLVLKAAAAVALAAVAPAAAILPLVKLGNVKDADCAGALASVQQTRAHPNSAPTAAPAPPVSAGEQQQAQQQKK